jgi:uroporphyrinogen decarboxylase
VPRLHTQHGWRSHEVEERISEPKTKTDKCLIGGIGQNTTLVKGTPDEVDAQVKDAWEQVGRRGLILGPGCVANLNAPDENVLQLRRSVEETARR